MSNTGDRMYACRICGLAFEQEGVRDHLTEHASIKLIRCHHCQFDYSSTHLLFDHMYAAHIHPPLANPIKPHQPQQLPQQHQQQTRDEHQQNEEVEVEPDLSSIPLTQETGEFHQHEVFGNITERGIACVFCGKAFTRKDHMTRHVKNVHISQPVYSCNQCSENYATKQELTCHVVDNHPNVEGGDMYSCDYCGKFFKRKDHLTRHLRTVHSKPTSFPCTLCNNVLANRPDFETHYKISHPEVHIPQVVSEELTISSTTFDCEFCGREFNRKDHMGRHIRTIHANEGKAECHKCRENFTTFVKLQEHMAQLHPESGPGSNCLECGRSFPNLATLNRHHKTFHLKVDGYNCQYCDQGFKLKKEMLSHVRDIHLQRRADMEEQISPKNYKQDYQASTKSIFKLANNYQCDVCQKTFHERTQLNRHLKRVHTSPRKQGIFSNINSNIAGNFSQ